MAAPAQVDSVVPRAKAFFHALLPAIAFIVGYPVAAFIVGLTGFAMALSVVGGPKASVFGQTFKAVRPMLKIGPGRMQAVAPHRFSEALGAIVLLVSAGAYAAGAHGLAETLALIVVALAALNTVAGICVGCQMYLLIKKLQPGTTA